MTTTLTAVESFTVTEDTVFDVGVEVVRASNGYASVRLVLMHEGRTVFTSDVHSVFSGGTLPLAGLKCRLSSLEWQ